VEELKKTTKTFDQDNRPQGRDLNPGPPKYEAGVLPFDSTTTLGSSIRDICVNNGIRVMSTVGLRIGTGRELL
jgi:hypothetical protein